MGDLREAFSDGEQREDDSLLFNVPATHIVLNGLHVKHQVFQSCSNTKQEDISYFKLGLS